MWGSDTETTSSGPSNPEVDKTLTQLLQGVQGRHTDFVTSPTNANQAAGWASQVGAAGNPSFASGVNGAMSDFARAASGDDYGANDAYYAKLGDDTLRDVNAMFTNSGRLGSGSHVETAVGALGDVNNANIAADRQWQAQTAGMLPQLFAAGQAPGSVLEEVGKRQIDAPYAPLMRTSAILSGTAGAGGTSQTSPATPWWLQAASLAGQFV